MRGSNSSGRDFIGGKTRTAFQAAFWAGYPITERWEHGYRVGYYDDGEGPGMDATVYFGMIVFPLRHAEQRIQLFDQPTARPDPDLRLRIRMRRFRYERSHGSRRDRRP